MNPLLVESLGTVPPVSKKAQQELACFCRRAQLVGDCVVSGAPPPPAQGSWHWRIRSQVELSKAHAGKRWRQDKHFGYFWARLRTKMNSDRLTASPLPPQASSICRAAIHYGVLDDRGGLVDITRNGKVPFFVKSERNGVHSLSKYKSSSSFMVSKVKEQDVDCYATVAQLCPFEKSGTHCPR
ncbi:Cysteine-rich secretory protein LCCL domain-containing 2 [Galemys pyrenaicus]|uniref:Cysteine-rich secretory protein LCCL domain-containing 2 n=1 Tax=Galemys pyrenaicus TaxID=202257 RepID=A0A8J6A6P1_GALPY|nr:Cysteine-rich secretory protein LCCL domain-containing 2 [Galemys pyrenaicus]